MSSLNDLILEAKQEKANLNATANINNDLPISKETAFAIPSSKKIKQFSSKDASQILAALSNLNILFATDKIQADTHNKIRAILKLDELSEEEQSGFNYALTYMSVNSGQSHVDLSALEPWQWDLIMLSIAVSAKQGPVKYRPDFQKFYQNLAGEPITDERLEQVSCAGCAVPIEYKTAKKSSRGYRCPLCF